MPRHFPFSQPSFVYDRDIGNVVSGHALKLLDHSETSKSYPVDIFEGYDDHEIGDDLYDDGYPDSYGDNTDDGIDIDIDVCMSCGAYYGPHEKMKRWVRRTPYDIMPQLCPKCFYEDEPEAGLSIGEMIRDDFADLDRDYYKFEDLSWYDEAYEWLDNPDRDYDRYLDQFWFEDRVADLIDHRAYAIQTIRREQGWSKNFLKQKRDRRKLKCLQQKRLNAKKASYPVWF